LHAATVLYTATHIKHSTPLLALLLLLLLLLLSGVLC
jgi:hypothetical protein